MKAQNKSLASFGLEFISIFIAVFSAFMLNNWNENRKSDQAGEKILTEMVNGLELDLIDLKNNIHGHKAGYRAVDYWRKAILNKPVPEDSCVMALYSITRDFVCNQNVSAYESLKSRGLEFIKNDSLRYQIIRLYEFDYNVLQKLEEEYYEMQFHENYFAWFCEVLAPFLEFNEYGFNNKLNTPVTLSEQDKKQFLMALFRIEQNRLWIAGYYNDIMKKVENLIEHIESELEMKKS